MDETRLLLFLAASLVVIVAPGPDNILVLTRGVTLGRKAALVSATGASTGLICHSLFAAAGLSAILASSATAYSIIKYLGAAYLIYLGVRSLLERKRFVLSPGGAPSLGLRRVYGQALLSNIFNPKIAVFFLAYLPQFAGPSSGGVVTLQLLVLGLIFASMTWVIFVVFAYFSGALGSLLRRRPRTANVLSWLTGGVLVGLGLRLAWPERR